MEKKQAKKPRPPSKLKPLRGKLSPFVEQLLPEFLPPQGRGHFDRFFVVNAMIGVPIDWVEAEATPVAAGGTVRVIKRTVPIQPGEVAIIEVPGPDLLTCDVTVRVVYGGQQTLFTAHTQSQFNEYIKAMTVGLGDVMFQYVVHRWPFGLVYSYTEQTYMLGPGDIQTV